MKKLLTVLLAMAIVCTYSIPAVFADTTDPVAAAKANMNTAIDTYYSANFVYNQSGKLATVAGVTTATIDGTSGTAIDTNLTKTAIDATIAQIKSDLGVKIQTEYASNANADLDAIWKAALAYTASTSTGYAPNLAAIIFGTITSDDATVMGSYGAANGILYTTAVSEVKTAAQTYMDSVDPSLYADADAAAIKAGKITLSNAITAAVNSKAGLANLNSAVGAFQTLVGSKTKKADTAAALATAKTKAEAAVAAAANAFKDSEYQRLSTVAKAGGTNAADAQAKLNNLEANVAAVKAFYNSKIEAITVDDTNPLTLVDTAKAAGIAAFAITSTGDYTTESAAFYADVTSVATKADLIKYAESYATTMKNAYDQTTGLAKYNATTVDGTLDTVKGLINDGTLTTYAAIKTYMDNNTNTATQDAAALTTYKAQAILDITKTSDVAVTNTDKVSGTTLVALKGEYAKTAWAGKYQSAIGAIQDEYTAKINVATSKEAIIALVKEAQAKMDAVALTKTAAASLDSKILANLTSLGYATAKTGQGGTLASYAAAKKATGTYSDAIINGALQQASDVLYQSVYDQKNVNMTNAQIMSTLQANYAAALAKIDAMKTTADLTAAANAVIAAIKALPTTVTLADKDKYLAVEKQYEDYLDLAGAQYTDITNQSLLDAYMTNLIGLEKDAVIAQIKALPSTITAADYDAVTAAKKAADAYEDAYSGYDGSTAGMDYSYSAITGYYGDTLASAVTALNNSLLLDAAKKIAAIPELPTLADADAVKAARAAYDKLTDLQKSTFSTALVAKLTAAEKTLSAEQIAATQSLKLTAKSAAVKGKMTITWKVNGTAVTGVKYQVMRSLHKNYGYKLMKTTSLKKYVNTKNLKAGKTYYYKVRAFITVDGVKYYSDWSNKAFRTAK